MIDPQRGTDLLRYARHFLFDAGLISQNELAGLQMHEGAVPRLEGYDATRRNTTIETLKALPCAKANIYHDVVECLKATGLSVDRFCPRCRALAEAKGGA